MLESYLWEPWSNKLDSFSEIDKKVELIVNKSEIKPNQKIIALNLSSKKQKV